MGDSGRLATLVDIHMLVERRGAVIAHPRDALALRTGAEVAEELGGRLLLHYPLPADIGRYAPGRSTRCYVTLTPYGPEEACSYLFLPRPHIPRVYVYLLDPERIPWIQGPQWAALGGGIQYILPNGFPSEAVVVPGAGTGHWEVTVT